jgi:D-alanyl-D-alanine carboxypeptidase
MVIPRRAALLPLAASLVALAPSCHGPASSSSSSSPSPSPSPSTPPSTSSSSSPPPPPPDASASSSPFPFGSPSPIPTYACPLVLPGGPFRRFLSPADAHVSFVDGDDLLALVNRSPTGALSPDYAPRDLVDIRDLSPRSPGECDGAHTCLRHDAAVALHAMLDAMKAAGTPGRVESAFRGFRTQCWVFGGWAGKAHGGFCEATTQSALPGHSQHQLGTTVDMFTSDWAAMGSVFRDGFGCTPGGRWLDDNAWTYGFVLPYPIDPDDRKDGSRCATRWDHAVPIDPKTGYKHEPWHLRFVGKGAAARLHAAWTASGPGTPDEITLEQWLRAQRGLPGDSALPVCDGCECGACATMAAVGADEQDVKVPCGDASLQLDAAGLPLAPAEPPHLVDASIEAAKDGVRVVDVKVHAPAHTLTQPPVTTDQEPTYLAASTFASLCPYADTKPHHYDDLPGAWRVAVEPSQAGEPRWPWRASLAKPALEATWNRANVLLPGKAGDAVVQLRIVLPAEVHALRVTLLRDGIEHDTREVPVP